MDTTSELQTGTSLGGEKVTAILHNGEKGERRVFTIQSYKSRELEGCALHSSVKCN